MNADDPALFVPKRSGLGYTLNFGNRWAWPLRAILLLALLLPVVFAISYGAGVAGRAHPNPP